MKGKAMKSKFNKQRKVPALLPNQIAATPAQAAEMLGVHVATIYKMHARGELPMRKIGRASRIPVASIHALIEGAV